MSTRPSSSELPPPGPQDAETAETVALTDGSAEEAGPDPGGTVYLTPPVTGSLVGTTIHDYDILGELGRGGMGVVYKARQISLDRTVALKMLLGDHFEDPVRRARFLAEARASASLNHPNIVQVYQVGESRFGPYFAMEYVDGEALEAHLARGRFAVPAAVSLLIVLSESVHYAHTRSIVHRDLKPANILIDSNRRPVVMDFGIAKVLGKSSSLTQEGVIMGTPAYMAPEQAAGQLDRVGPASDVYSLGAILYTLLTGRPTFDEGGALSTVLKVIGPDLPPHVRDFRPEVPEALERICMKCLNKAAADRYPSAHALADHLRRFRASLASPRGDAAPARRRAALPTVFVVATATGRCVRLSQERTVLGRASECDLVLRSSDVSKQHCQLLLTPDGLTVEDLDSANGILVNGRPVQRARLHDGDELTVVRHHFRVRLPQASQ